MKKLILLSISIMFFAHCADAQFWFGPKVGVQRTNYKYRDDNHSNLYNVDVGLNYNVGVAIEYSTTGAFEIHTEIVYQRVSNKVTNKEFLDPIVSESTYNYISAPLLMRAVFGTPPFNFYVNFGPRLSYWLGGSGSYFSDEFSDFSDDPRKYDIVFAEPTQNLVVQGDAFFIPRPNRLQYAFDFGGGLLLGINENQRVMIDVRYSFGHSNMAFNDGSDLGNLFNYDEDLEYAHRMMIFSVAYVFGYDIQAKKKGRSTRRISK